MENGDAHKHKAGNEENFIEEISLRGDYTQVEKEATTADKSSQLPIPTMGLEETPLTVKLDSSSSVKEFEEKIKALVLQVKSVAKELHNSESKKAQLKSNVDLANRKLEKLEKHREELELDRKKMKEQALETEDKYNSLIQSLQEALDILDVKHKQLADVNNEFSELSAEPESSRKKIEDLEVLSASERENFEELSTETTFHAELESRKVLELGKMLEIEESSAKELKEKMGNLQGELEGLSKKIAENHQIQEELSNTTLGLSVVQEKLNLSTSQVDDLEHKLISREIAIEELAQELNLLRTPQRQIKEDVMAPEILLSVSSDNMELELKLKSLEELHHETKTATSVANQRNVELQASLQASQMAIENERYTEVMLTNQLLGVQMMADREYMADVNYNIAFSHNDQLVAQLKSLEVLYRESKTAVEATNQRNAELQALLQSSHIAEEGAKVQLRETEVQFLSAEKRNTELGEQLINAELKCADADREIKELNEKIMELNTSLRSAKEKSLLSKSQFKSYKEKISHLESSLNSSFSRNSGLEQELKDLKDRWAEHEGRASASHQRSLELEDLIHVSHSKLEDAGKEADELEQLLEGASNRTEEQEQLLSNAESKHREAEAESKQNKGRAFELSSELQVFQTKSASLDAVLTAANEKEIVLADRLNSVIEESKKFENMSNVTGEKLLQAENFIEVLKDELKSKQGKLGNVDVDLEASVLRENEILQMLKSADEQLEKHGRAVEQAYARNIDLEALHESFPKDSKLKLREAVMQKKLESKQLDEILKTVQEQATYHQDQAAEAAEKLSCLEIELDASASKLVYLENTVEELKIKVSVAEAMTEQSVSENGLLIATNSKLHVESEAHQSKVKELHDLLSPIHTEKEATAQQSASHVNTISKLTDENSRGLERQSSAESHIKETEDQLHGTIEKFTQKDSEARDLNEKLFALEARPKFYEKQVSEEIDISESRKIELEETYQKLQNLGGFVQELQSKAMQFEAENEGLANANLKLSQEQVEHKTKMNELRMSLNEGIAEKEGASRELDTLRNVIEDLVQQLASNEEKLQSQISSLMGENNMLNKLYRDAKEELKAALVQMKERIGEQREREVSLIVDLEQLKVVQSEKSLMQSQLSELKKQLILLETRYKEKIEGLKSAVFEKDTELALKLEEQTNILQKKKNSDELLKQIQAALSLAQQNEVISRKEMQKEAAARQSLGELEAEHHRATLLENQVEELKQKLEISETQSKEKRICRESKREILAL